VEPTCIQSCAVGSVLKRPDVLLLLIEMKFVCSITHMCRKGACSCYWI